MGPPCYKKGSKVKIIVCLVDLHCFKEYDSTFHSWHHHSRCYSLSALKRIFLFHSMFTVLTACHHCISRIKVKVRVQLVPWKNYQNHLPPENAREGWGRRELSPERPPLARESFLGKISNATIKKNFVWRFVWYPPPIRLGAGRYSAGLMVALILFDTDPRIHEGARVNRQRSRSHAVSFHKYK